MRRFISLFFTLVIIFASVITVLSRSVYAEGELVLVSTSGLTQNVEVGDIFTVTAKAKNVADTEVYIWTTYGISAGSMATDNYFESPGSSSITSSSGKSAYVGSSMNNDNFNYTGTQLTLDPNETMTLVFKVKAVKAFDGTFNHGFNITYRPAGDSNKNFNIHGSDTDGTLNVDSSSSSSDSGSSNSSSSSSSSGS